MNNRQEFEDLISMWNSRPNRPVHNVFSAKSHKCRTFIETAPIKASHINNNIKLDDIKNLDHPIIQLQHIFHLVSQNTAKRLRQILLKNRANLLGNPNANIGINGRTILDHNPKKNNLTRWKCEIEIFTDKIDSLTLTFIQVERQNNPTAIYAIRLIDIIPNS